MRKPLAALSALLLAACSASVGDARSPFDTRYDPGFRLRPLSPDEPPAPPAPLAPGAGIVEPTYGTWLFRATSVDDGSGGRMRHEYSRRQAFNADNSRLLAQDATGHWHLYDDAGSHLGRLDLAGDCEPLWHPSDPTKLLHTERGGGLRWHWLDVSSGRRHVAFDLTGRTPWPEATEFWTRSEGTTSADGRIITLLATRYEPGGQLTAHGVLTLDVTNGTVLGTLDADDFPTPGALPDHVSTAPSGEYAVVSWLAGAGGTVAYSLDFGESRQLAPGSEHSDLALGPDGADLLVYADYGRGQLTATALATGTVVELHPLYPAAGEAYAVHISGQAFDRPGWAVVSTYADSAEHGAVSPAPVARAEYRKVWLMELVPGGRRLNLAHTQSGAAADEVSAYFLEPQASASRDLSRVIFASDFGSGRVESHVVGLPSWALDS